MLTHLATSVILRRAVAIRKKKISIVCLSMASFVVLALLGLGAALKYEPAFYRNATIEPSAQRSEQSAKALNDFLQLAADLKFDQDGWHHDFKDHEINSFFQEDFVKQGEGGNLKNLGVSEPRVAFEDDRIRVAFRWGHGFWSTVVSWELKVWVVPRETNVVAVEVISRRAGAVPIPAQTLIAELTEILAKRNVEVLPYRHEGNLVALLRFQADQPRPMAQLRSVQVTQG